MLDQPEFLNACIRIETGLAPEELLDACKAVERELGRRAGGVRHGPRPIDVDVLLLGDETHRSVRLSLPHEQVTSRRFVLVPLLELAPDLDGAGRRPRGRRARPAGGRRRRAARRPRAVRLGHHAAVDDPADREAAQAAHEPEEADSLSHSAGSVPTGTLPSG